MTTLTAIITGGGSGVGRAAAVALSRRGFNVVLAGRRAEILDGVAREITDEGGTALAHVADITREDDVQRLFAAAGDHFGRVDLLFNNAGAGPPQIPLEDLSLEQWRGVIDINLTGAFLCVREAFRVMKAQTPQGGRIINNGSLSAHAPRPNSCPYTASKHAMTGITKTAALDGRKYGIAVGQIDIGNTASDMAAQANQGLPQANGSIVVEPLMDAAHVADAIVYMATLPLSANVQFLTVLPTQMPFVGRG